MAAPEPRKWVRNMETKTETRDQS